MTKPKGVMFFWDNEPHVTGYIVIGDDHYELAGVRRSKIRTDFEGRKIETGQQSDMFNERSGDGTG
jgi:hypothetical protein